MNPSRLFILRPVATTLLMAALLVVGFVAWRHLPLSALPSVEYATIQVQTFYPGASPDVITSATLPLTEAQTLADTRLAQKISQLPGVGLVTLSGGHKPAIRVRANIRAMAAYGLNLDDLRTTFDKINANTPKGTLDGPHRAYTIDANDHIEDPAEYLNTVIAYKNGRPVLLSDVVDVVRGAENSELSAWMNTTPAIILNIQRQPGANVIEVVDSIKAMLPEWTAGLPSSVEVTVLSDRTTTIRASVEDVQFDMRCQENGIEHRLTKVTHPWTDGQVE